MVSPVGNCTPTNSFLVFFLFFLLLLFFSSFLFFFYFFFIFVSSSPAHHPLPPRGFFHPLRASSTHNSGFSLFERKR